MLTLIITDSPTTRSATDTRPTSPHLLSTLGSILHSLDLVQAHAMTTSAEGVPVSVQARRSHCPTDRLVWVSRLFVTNRDSLSWYNSFPGVVKCLGQGYPPRKKNMRCSVSGFGTRRFQKCHPHPSAHPALPRIGGQRSPNWAKNGAAPRCAAKLSALKAMRMAAQAPEDPPGPPSNRRPPRLSNTMDSLVFPL